MCTYVKCLTYTLTVEIIGFFDQMKALASLVLGMGNPSPKLINTVGAYFHTVFGALIVIPVYSLGK